MAWPLSLQVFHDTLITIGAFSLTNQEISPDGIAAILTLVGYSMNDTIVVSIEFVKICVSPGGKILPILLTEA